jgi:hypothetical protein
MGNIGSKLPLFSNVTADVVDMPYLQAVNENHFRISKPAGLKEGQIPNHVIVQHYIFAGEHPSWKYAPLFRLDENGERYCMWVIEFEHKRVRIVFTRQEIFDLIEGE